ncbi:MAG: hypothetical protein ACLFTR_04180 [Candidatus Woesearchaeota archaeon]
MSFMNLLQESFTSWLWLFGAPIRDINILWILIPIWVSWFFTEFFQEKRGTGFGNAITNGGVSLWVAIDWARHLTNDLASDNITIDYTLYTKFALCGFVLIYGLVVIIKGLKRNKFASIGGRIRVITYILVMFTPIVYDTSSINLMNIVSIFIYFPLFYFILEIVDRIIPDSKALETDKETKKAGADTAIGAGLDNHSSPFAADTSMQHGNDNGMNQGSNNQPSPAPNSNPFSQGGSKTQPVPENQRNGIPEGQPSMSRNPNRPTPNPAQRQAPNQPQMQKRYLQPQQQPRQQYQEPDFNRLPDKEKYKKNNPFSSDKKL